MTINFKSWLEGVSGFTTSQGSTYRFDGTRSQRNKSSHQYHDPTDVGTKPPSDRTVFVRQPFAREVGMWGTSSSQKKRIILAGNKVYLLSWNDMAGKHGLDKIMSDNTFATAPSVGLCPLELWTIDRNAWPWLKPGMEVFKSSHPGNEITAIQ